MAKRMDQATYVQGIVALASKLEETSLLPEGAELPGPTLEGVMRSLDLCVFTLIVRVTMCRVIPCLRAAQYRAQCDHRAGNGPGPGATSR